MTTPAAVLALLTRIKGIGCLTGQFSEVKGMAQIQTGGAIATIDTLTGQWPAILGGDYWYYGSTSPLADLAFNAAAISYARAGGLATLTLSMPNPTSGGASNDISALDTAGLLIPGTATNTAFMATLDSIAAGLAPLDAAGVPVGVRMYHENNAVPMWFWWHLLSPPQFITLWKFTRDYLVLTKGLQNLYFIWAVNTGFTTMPPMPRYPGDFYVDVTGLDGYTSTPAGLISDIDMLLTLGKPVLLSEFGSGSPNASDPNFQMPTLVAALREQMPRVVGFQTWWAPWGIETMPNAKTAMNDPWLINRGGFALAAPPPPAPVVSSASIIPTLVTQLEQAAALLTSIKAGLETLT